MLHTVKKLALGIVCAAAMIPAAHAELDWDKIPAFDKNDLTILDERGNCVLTKWDAMGGNYCGESTVGSMGNIIFFDFDSSALSAESKAKLDRLYARLTNDSEQILRANIVGYADEIGTDSYNQRLSERRASAVNNYLTGLGYQNSEVTDVRALGERSSAGKCPTTMSRKARIACLWQDRRVEIELEFLNRYERRIVR